MASRPNDSHPVDDIPVPMLDGGHLVFQIYEAIFRKPATPRVMEIGFRVALLIVRLSVSTSREVAHPFTGWYSTR